MPLSLPSRQEGKAFGHLLEALSVIKKVWRRDCWSLEALTMKEEEYKILASDELFVILVLL